MEEADVFVLADRALAEVVAQIRPEQWGMTMPANFATRSHPAAPGLREVINYHAYDDAWVPDMLAGRTMEEAGATKFDGDLLGGAPVERFEGIVRDACAAADGVRDYDAVAHLSFGDFSVREYFWQINQFRALRAHDIARALGLELHLSEALVEGLWEEVAPHADEWRTIGVYPAAVPVSDDAPLLDRLLALTGRDPAGS